ncbi:MAG: NAD(P)-dependent alcohol dehydrogenase, partial [Acidimicrobiia bacterium]
MSPVTMKAALLRDWNDLAVEEVPVPEPGPGEVLV